MAIDISGIVPTSPLQHLRMTIGDGTINYTQKHTPFVGTVNTSMVRSPTIAAISGKFDTRWDDPQYYAGNTGI